MLINIQVYFTMSKISIVTSLYKSDLISVKRCFESLFEDPFFKYCELIIVDDTHNPNDVISYIQDLSLNFSNIFIIKNINNIGLTKSLNLAIKSASSELITRIDFDDYFHEKRLEMTFNHFKNNKNCILTFTSYILVVKNSEKVVLSSAKKLKFRMLMTNPIVHSTVTFRKYINSELVQYDEMFNTSQDFELWSRLMNHGEFFCFENLYSIKREILLTGVSLSKKSFLQAYNSLLIRINILKFSNRILLFPIVLFSFFFQIFSTIRLFLFIKIGNNK